jgi:nicotinate-nucleotide adenylyltransferase
MPNKTPVIGILGGTFDPIHIGHLRLALEMQQRFKLEYIKIIPCRQNAHKLQPIASSRQRLHMIQTAIANESTLQVDDIEVTQPGISYTINTLITLRHKMPTSTLALILGMDNFINLPTWHNWLDILNYAHVLLVPRPNYQLAKTSPATDLITTHLASTIEEIHDSNSGKIFFAADTPPLAISATNIRQQLANGKNPRYLLPEKVYNFIVKHKLYHPS